MTTSTLRTIRRLESINEEQCDKWVRNEGRINPITRARINPNLTSESSMNVLISNKCFENFGITRPGNPYNNIMMRTSSQNTRTSPQRTSPQNARTSPQNARNEINMTRASPPTSTLRRKTHTVYRNKNGDIKIDGYSDYTMEQLNKWWNHGVMRKNDKIHLRNADNRRIKENSATYNRLLQCADTICLIPVNLSFVYENGYLSEESCEILKSIRKEIDEDDWRYEDMVRYFKSPEKSYISKMARLQKYRQYISIFNSRERLENLTQDTLDIVSSIDKKSLSSKSIDKYDQINTLCLDKFVNIHDKFKKFKNKMMRTCNENNKCSLLSDIKIKKLLDTFNKKDQIVYYNVINHPSIISLFAKYMTNLDDENILNTSKMKVVNYQFNEEGNLKYSDGSDMGGLSNQMITNISNELFDMKIFIKPQNSTKYFFNPEFMLSDEHKSILQIIINASPSTYDVKTYLNNLIQTDNFYNIFYQFIGRLLSFFLMNSFKLPHHLSSHILNCLKYKSNKIKDLDHVMYVLNDFPDISNSILNMMKTNPEEIESYDIEYNDLYKIQYDKENGDHVTSENFEQYFIDFAKHLNIHNTTPVSENKNLDIDFSNYYEKFSNGINNNLRKLFQQKDISYMTIDKMLTKEEINEEILSQLSDNILNNISFTRNDNAADIDEYNDRGLQYGKKYQKYIDNLLLNKNTGFSKEEHNNFIKKMLEFWTGIDFFKPEINYKMLIVMDNTTGYPVSHTCFNRVDFPLYETEEEFLQKLKFAVENSHNTFTIAGGKKKTNI